MTEQEFTQHYAKYSRVLLRFLASKGVPPEDREDIAQDTWRNAWKARETYCGRNGAGFGSWLTAIAWNALQTNVRKRGDVVLLPLKDEHYQLPAAAPGADFSQSMPLVVDALKRVRYGDYLIMRYYFGVPVVDLAERLGIPEGTVKCRTSRARERVVSRLELRGGRDGVLCSARKGVTCASTEHEQADREVK